MKPVELDLTLLAEIVREQRAEQGLPPVIQDTSALTTIARLVYGGGQNKKRTRPVLSAAS